MNSVKLFQYDTDHLFTNSRSIVSEDYRIGAVIKSGWLVTGSVGFSVDLNLLFPVGKCDRSKRMIF